MKLGLALGGGGARGLAHIGVLKVFEQEGIPIHFIVGCSIGAVVGAAYALHGSSEKLIEMAHELIEGPLLRKMGIDFLAETEVGREPRRLDDILTYLKFRINLMRIFNKPAYFDEEQVEMLFEPFKGHTFRELKIPFAAVATDLISGEEVVLNKGDLFTAVRASAAIPGIFPPVKMDTMLLVDGGATDTIPVHVVKQKRNTLAVAVNVSKDVRVPGPLTNALYIIYRADEITSHLLTQTRLGQADVIIRPKVHNIPWTSFKHLDKLIKLGEEAAEAMLPEIEAKLTGKISARIKSWIKRLLR